jgi:N-acetylglucosamine malate deacetylase 1
MKIDILAIGVHPDDIELSCCGTLLKHIAMGKTVGLIDLTRGEMGTRGSAEIRTKEAQASMKLMGAKFREYLDMKDGFFQNDEIHQRKIIEVIRKYKPEIVLCNAVTDRHPDHGRSAQLVAEACFLAGLRKIETSSDNARQEAWRPKAVYHYIQDNFIEPDFVIDITSFADKKKECIMSFASQFFNENSNEPETPISSPEFLESIYSKMSVYGREIGVRYAEGFTSSRYIGVTDLFALT